MKRNDWNQDEINFLVENSHLTVEELMKHLSRTSASIRSQITRLEKDGKLTRKTGYEVRKANTKTRQANEMLEQKVEILLKERDALLKLREQPQKIEIIPKHKTEVSEGVPIIVASDWHIEELVKSSTVNNLNSFNLKIAEERVIRFFQRALRLIQIQERDVKVNTVVLALLGDFISGSIHDELMENNQLLPAEAIWKAQSWIISGIDFLLKHTKHELIVPCQSGNHARMTQKQRHSTEAGNSLEVLMYQNLDLYYRKNKRVKFIISDAYHTYLDIFGTIIRFHHGHSVKYGGGIGGIYIPTNKAIAQWNKAYKADLDIFGHYHNLKDGGNFICNGSLIGWNAYAIHIKADFEKPKQAFTVIYKKYGKGGTFPIWLE